MTIVILIAARRLKSTTTRIGTNNLVIHEGSGSGEFDALWRNRGNRLTGSGHEPMFIKTLPSSNLQLHTETPPYKTTHISTVWPYRTTLRT